MKRLLCIALMLAAFAGRAEAQESAAAAAANDPRTVEEEQVDVREVIFGHIQDNYWWHITTVGDRHVTLWLPVIVRSPERGWFVFSSHRLDHGASYEGFSIAASGKHEGKIVETGPGGTAVKPLDISITKNALALMINSALMLAIFLYTARWYRKRPPRAAPGGFAGAMETVVMYVEDEVIRPSVGPQYRRYSPYLLSAFFFILINNLMGLLPIFPGGANTTGNIAVTLALALFTMVIVNVFGNREYWKEIFWPDVPVWMKAPIPLMPVIEVFGIISKPFALMIRLFANIMAGHTAILALMCIIFVTSTMGAAISGGMSFFSVLLTMVMNALEILVAFIQAYVFTMLSAVFIGMAHPAHHPKEKTE